MLPIVYYPDPLLAKVSEPVSDLGSIRDFAGSMIETMRGLKGVGLAAIQVGKPLQMFVLDAFEDDFVIPECEYPVRNSLQETTVFINPEVSVIELGLPKIKEEEGCLSIPNYRTIVERDRVVCVEAVNLEGERFKIFGTGLLGRAIQHEFDHLKGILIVDRLSRLRKRAFLDGFKKGKFSPEETYT